MFKKISLKLARKIYPYQALEKKINLLERAISYYDVRIDAIYKSLTHGSAAPCVGVEQIPQLKVSVSAAGEGALYKENERSQLKAVDPVALSYLQPKLDDASKGYFDVHWKRLYETLRRLEAIPDAGTAGRVLEIGPSDAYQARLKRIFPAAEFAYIGKPFINDEVAEGSTGTFYDFDLEAGDWPVQGSFDVVLCFEVIEHFFRDPMRLFTEVNRLLKPGGRLVLTTPNIASCKAIKALLTHYAPHCYVKFSPDAPLYTTHRTEFTMRDIAEFARAAGFSAQVETFESYSSEQSPMLTDLLAQMGLDVQHRGDTLYAVLTKQSEPVERYPSWFYV